MENASKALLIAGGVLVAVVIISLAVILYTIFSNHSREYNEIMNITHIQKFNSKFEVYIGREDITAQEIATVVNLSNEYNNIVEVVIMDKSNIIQTYTNPEMFVKTFLDNKFECLDTVYNTTGKIIKIKFKEKL